MLLLTRAINIKWEETLRDSFDDIQLLGPATVLDIQIIAKVIDKWNSTISRRAWCALGVHRIFRVLLVVLMFVFQQNYAWLHNSTIDCAMQIWIKDGSLPEQNFARKPGFGRNLNMTIWSVMPLLQVSGYPVSHVESKNIQKSGSSQKIVTMYKLCCCCIVPILF